MPFATTLIRSWLSGQGAFAASVAIALSAVIVAPAAAKTAVEVCHEFAAHPHDPHKDPAVAGVADADFDGSLSIDACIDAYTATPEDPAIAFQLARSFIQLGDMDQGWSYLIYAAELGNSAAMHLYGQLIEANTDFDPDELGMIYGQSKDLGFTPAEADAARYPAPVVAETTPTPVPGVGGMTPAFDLSRFSRPDLVKAMIDGDVATLRNFKVGVMIEELGISAGLTRYMTGFDTSLSQAFFCPTALPAGVSERIAHFTTMSALGAMPGLLNKESPLPGVLDTIIKDPARGMLNMAAMETELKVVEREGTRDAMLLAEDGCKSPELLAIGKTFEKLLDGIRH